MFNPVVDALAISFFPGQPETFVAISTKRGEQTIDSEIALAIQRESLRGKSCGKAGAKPGQAFAIAVVKKDTFLAGLCKRDGLSTILAHPQRVLSHSIRFLLFGLARIKLRNLSHLSTAITTITTLNNKELIKKQL